MKASAQPSALPVNNLLGVEVDVGHGWQSKEAPPGSTVAGNLWEGWQITKQMQLLAFCALTLPKQAQHKGSTVQIKVPELLGFN